jgi:hypothetical protein
VPRPDVDDVAGDGAAATLAIRVPGVRRAEERVGELVAALDDRRPGRFRDVGEVPVDRVELLAGILVPPVERGEPGADPGLVVLDRCPGRRIRAGVEAEPVGAACGEQRRHVREVAVHGQARDPGRVGDRGDRRPGRPNGRVQPDRGVRDPLPRLVDALGAPAHPIGP